jgi:predicted helicase
MSKSFNTIIEKYRKISFSERDKGDRFERLIQSYLQTEPLYANKFKTVWMWNARTYTPLQNAENQTNAKGFIFLKTLKTN